MAWGYWNRFRRVIIQTHLGYVQSILNNQKKSKIIDLIQSRKLPQPDNLPGEVPPRPVTPIRKDGTRPNIRETLSIEEREILYKQKAWDLKYRKYYNPDGKLMVNPGDVDKSFNEKVKETF